MIGHDPDECTSCSTMEVERAERPASPLLYSDPEAWGYCRVCAFVVARDPDLDVLLFHEPLYAGSVRKECSGSGRPPTPQPGTEANPLKLVKITKTIQQIGDGARRRAERNRIRYGDEPEVVHDPPDWSGVGPLVYQAWYGAAVSRPVHLTEPGPEALHGDNAD